LFHSKIPELRPSSRNVFSSKKGSQSEDLRSVGYNFASSSENVSLAYQNRWIENNVANEQNEYNKLDSTFDVNQPLKYDEIFQNPNKKDSSASLEISSFKTTTSQETAPVVIKDSVELGSPFR